MTTFLVQLWPEGKWDGKHYQRIEANSARAAAEKHYGRQLADKGTNFAIRAQVRQLGDIKSNATIFYKP
jgi:hypothetical protein